MHEYNELVQSNRNIREQQLAAQTGEELLVPGANENIQRTGIIVPEANESVVPEEVNSGEIGETIEVIKPKIVVVTAVAGSVEYTQNLENTFPTTQALKNIAKYTDKVYVHFYPLNQ